MRRAGERNCKQKKMTSALRERCYVESHRPDFKSFRVLDVEKGGRRRKIKRSRQILANQTFERKPVLIKRNCFLNAFLFLKGCHATADCH